MQPAKHARRSRLVVRQRWNTQVGKRFHNEVAVRLGNQLVDVAGRAFGGDLGGHDDVDAVGLAVGVLVHPVQHGLEIVGIVEAHAAEHAEPTSLADRCGDRLRRGEDEDRIVDAEAVTQLGAHQVFAPT
jgi:hypothetical protein